MSANSIKSFMEAENSALRRIFAKVELLNQLNELLNQVLEPSLKRFCLVANLYEDRLVVLAQNAAIATQFRFTIPEILPELQKHPLLKNIRKIECKLSI